MDDNKHKEVNDLLNRIFKEDSKLNYYPLTDLFKQRLEYLGISEHQAAKILGIDQKTLASIVSGDTKKVDIVTLMKFSDFLEISYEETLNKYFEMVKDTHSENIQAAKKRSFIINNFNLSSLKKIGFIESINDFDEIEKKILDFFGYEDVYEHDKYRSQAVYSSAKRKTSPENLAFWRAVVGESVENTPNPYKYNRDGLVEFFPKIRWFSLDAEEGFLKVSQELFKLGITMIMAPKFFSDMHIRGATWQQKDKPCIALTKYSEFYGSMWFALIHELYHVLFDWDTIKEEKWHITGESESLKINEAEADDFARQYLFSDEKMKVASQNIDNARFIKIFAEQNHVHHDIIYTFYKWDTKDDNKKTGTGKNNAWAKYYHLLPDFQGALDRYKWKEFEKFNSIKEITKSRNTEIFNSI